MTQSTILLSRDQSTIILLEKQLPLKTLINVAISNFFLTLKKNKSNKAIQLIINPHELGVDLINNWDG